MAKSRRFSILRKTESQEVGFGKTDNVQQRLMNSDGSYNYVRKGLPWHESFNFYHFFINSSWVQFTLIVFVWYTVMNFLFTGLYYAFCVENLTGLVYNNELERFIEVYFFSAQTLTTVGYGRINPMGFTAGMIASVEALFGLMSFALFTGLLYARFAKPNAVLKYSKNLLFSPYHNGIGLMFRFANQLNSNLMNMKVQITLSLLEQDEAGNTNRKFYTPLNLERDSIVFFPSSWTIVHPIDESSPLYGMNWDDIKAAQPEMMILATGFDESYNENIHSRHAYDTGDMIWGAKFIKILGTTEGGVPLVDLGKINHFDKVDIEDLVAKI